MYLFVFIFVILSVLGLYTELFTLRMARVLANQTTVAQTMMQWHGAANYLIRDQAVAIVPPPAGCSISVAVLNPFSCGFQLTTGLLPPRNIAYLPTDYNLNNETTFSSVIYANGTVRYLLTYMTANETKMGFNAGEVAQQITNARLSKIYYGSVATGGCGGAGTWFKTQAYSGGAQVCYPIPAAVVANVPVGSVGIISIF